MCSIHLPTRAAGGILNDRRGKKERKECGMVEFKFKCPQCGGNIEADESFSGQIVDCPHCGKSIVVPCVMDNSHAYRQVQNRSPSNVVSNPTMQRNADQMFCTTCGAIINTRAVVCPKCGVAVAHRRIAATSNIQVPNHMVGAILSALCYCLIGGIIAIVYASQVNSKLAQGDIAGAQAASKAANGWIIANVIIGLIVALFYFILGVMGA